MEKEINMTDLKDLIGISRYYGSNHDYVIAGGGNTSFKNKENLWIKATPSYTKARMLKYLMMKALFIHAANGLPSVTAVSAY